MNLNAFAAVLPRTLSAWPLPKTVTTSAVSDAPVAEDDALSVTLPGALTADLFADNDNGADTQPPGTTITALNDADPTFDESTTLASGALLTISEGGEITYDANAFFDDLALGETVTDSFTYTLASSNATLPGTFEAEITLGDFDGTDGTTLEGVAATDNSGRSVSGAGDVNNDGFADIIIGANGVDIGDDNNAGAAYLVFGSDAGLASIDLGTLDGTTGVRLTGGDALDALGWSVSDAGDVNGDGIGDVVIGAFLADPDGTAFAGASYVLFGSADAFQASIDLDTLDGTDGFKLTGESADDTLGVSVSAAGDVNGDGIDDLILGANQGDFGTGDETGGAYIVFGTDAGFGASIDVGTLDGTTGFAVQGLAEGDAAGLSVSAAGDVDADGFADILIGAPGADAVYLVHGTDQGFAPTLDLGALDGITGTTVTGTAGSAFGTSVADAGDVNGDGIADIIIGAPEDAGGAGSATVIFGQTGGLGATLDATALTGSAGFQITAKDAGDTLGISVSAAGDVNADGIDDLIVGAEAADPSGTVTGAAYVIFGSDAGFAGSIDVGALDGTAGFALTGADTADSAGQAVSAAGDVNGDGVDDLLVTALSADPGGASSAGETYIVYGRAGLETLTDAATVTIDVTRDDGGTLGQDLIAGTAGNDIVDGESGDDVLSGYAGDDTLIGGNGNDEVIGGAGDDILIGGVGADLLQGGAGADVMTGGADADRFEFVIGDGQDIITDFQAGRDELILDADLLDLSLSLKAMVSTYVSVANGDLVIGFGEDMLTLEGISDIREIATDIQLI
ncbi:MAG: hypothetical protein AAF281_08860 [Pseudomonadota bacterium]